MIMVLLQHMMSSRYVLMKHVKKQLQNCPHCNALAIGSDGQDTHCYVASQSPETGEDGQLLLAELRDQLADEGHPQEDTEVGQHGDQTGDLSIFEVDLEGDGNRGVCALQEPGASDPG